MTKPFHNLNPAGVLDYDKSLKNSVIKILLLILDYGKSLKTSVIEVPLVFGIMVKA